VFVHIVPSNPAHMQCADSNLGIVDERDSSAFGVCTLVMSVFLGAWCLGVYLHIRQMMSWEPGENCIMKRDTGCSSRKILLGMSRRIDEWCVSE
jgi:hypothetical protein